MIARTPLPALRVDLYSDNVTAPSAAMREVMARAPVAHTEEEDELVGRLERRACEVLGLPEAVFLASGTMCNELAYCAHALPRGTVLLDEAAEPLRTLQGGLASWLGVAFEPVASARGVLTPDDIARAACRPESASRPALRAISIEQPAAERGGSLWTMQEVSDAISAAHEHGLGVHVDGARLFDAAVALNADVRWLVDGANSVYIDLTKGLGAPTGALLCGDETIITEVRAWKRRIGATWRKVGILAAAGLFALDHNIELLPTARERALELYKALASIDGLVVHEPETTIVVIDAPTEQDAAALLDALAQAGIRLSRVGAARLRAVTYSALTSSDIQSTAATIAESWALVRSRVERPCVGSPGTSAGPASASPATRDAARRS